ncbi:LysR family transcriptional regulator [Tahibacter caeni]|uniref:LysR family transcriptional regulator n=1 Tax=Tahibacter caeni TaxID=1453545 RepID=UPI0021484B38|nr:LysR family transcriptional regulator [Tahibacter caeni]
MDDLRALAIFATVVRQGSMSAAARQLGLSASAVSQQVRALERWHGVTLLHRSTRKLTLSDAGARVYAECAQMVEAAERAQQQLRATRDEPSGELRVAAPIGFGPYLATALTPLLLAHPALSLRLLVDDAMIDLIDARIDLAIRVGRLPDSSWVARRLCAMTLVLCAAPAYRERRGLPQAPEELLAHAWLSQSGTATAARGLELQHTDGRRRAVHPSPNVASNNQLLLQQMCAAGLGIALIGSPDAHADLAAGRLARVLPDWALPPFDVWALTPQRDAQPAKVRHALAAIAAYFADMPGMLP